MNGATIIAWLALGLILARWLATQTLSLLNRRHVQANASRIPKAWEGVVDPATYAKSVQYTLARNRFNQFTDTYDTLILLGVLFSGLLPWGYRIVSDRLGGSSWAMALGLLVAGIAMSLPGLPADWINQFRLEQRFGFNTCTRRTWWLDRLKGLLLIFALGYPLLVLLLSIVAWAGPHWWLYAWLAFVGFQCLMTVLAPALILPLFNKLTPLPNGSLQDRLIALANRTDFHARSIQVMDGSRRSQHSNAFFTGLGRMRKIVLFDTLLDQLSESELEAVLAHEIGHYKRGHIPKMFVASAAGSLAGFYAMAWLAGTPTFVEAFGFGAVEPHTTFTPATVAQVLLLFGLLGGTITFWLSPLVHWLSRRYEYEADRYARDTIQDAQPLINALRRLNEKNLTNLTPHPVYSRFYYSHPTLSEREAALRLPAGSAPSS